MENKDNTEEVKGKVKLVSNFDELEKAEDLEGFLKDKKNIAKQEDGSYIVGNKYKLTPEEFVYFTEVVYKIK